MEIINIRYKKTMVCMGSWAYDAEMRLYDSDTQHDFFLHANYFDGENFTVSNESIYDYLDGDAEDNSDDEDEIKTRIEFLEEYESVTDASKSKYFSFFVLLDKIVTQVIHAERKSDEPEKCIQVLHKSCFVKTVGGDDCQYVAELSIKDDRKPRFIQVAHSSDKYTFTVTAKSIAQTTNKDSIPSIESFGTLDEAIQSKYGAFFCDLDNTLEAYMEEQDSQQ